MNDNCQKKLSPVSTNFLPARGNIDRWIESIDRRHAENRDESKIEISNDLFRVSIIENENLNLMKMRCRGRTW